MPALRGGARRAELRAVARARAPPPEPLLQETPAEGLASGLTQTLAVFKILSWCTIPWLASDIITECMAGRLRASWPHWE